MKELARRIAKLETALLGTNETVLIEMPGIEPFRMPLVQLRMFLQSIDGAGTGVGGADEGRAKELGENVGRLVPSPVVAGEYRRERAHGGD